MQMPAHEQFSLSLATRFDDQLYIKKHVPALFAQHPHPKMSGRYGFTDTYHLLQHLQRRGYTLRTVQQTGNGSFGKVLIRMQHPTLARSDHGAAEVVIIDSHDGTSAFTVRLGFIRFACANGLIISDDVFMRSFKHTQPDLVEQVILDLDEATESTSNVLDTILRMQRYEPSTSAMLDIARDVAIARFSLDVETEHNRIERAAAMLATTLRRSDDRASDLFTRMNVVQENALRGDVHYTHNGLTHKVRPVRAINTEVAVNRAAWNGAVKLLEAA